mgnify:CR=1 FL=1
MFSKFRKKGVFLYDPTSYSNAINFIESFVILSCSTKEEARSCLNYFLEVVGRDIETSVQALHIYKDAYCTAAERPFPEYCHTDFNTSIYLVDEKNTVPIDLSKNIVITKPWCMYERLLPNLKNIKANEFKYDKSNHFSTFYPYMNICAVWNVCHSISCGKHFKKGIIYSAVYDTETAFKYIDTDGRRWIFKGGFESDYDVKDFRFAFLFKIAKLLFDITHDKNGEVIDD